jgi:glutathione S-transferase
MRLIGIFLSPYVRRVAVSLNLLNLPFEEDQVFVFGEPDVVRRYNPLVRIPALVSADYGRIQCSSVRLSSAGEVESGL